MLSTILSQQCLVLRLLLSSSFFKAFTLFIAFIMWLQVSPMWLTVIECCDFESVFLLCCTKASLNSFNSFSASLNMKIFKLCKNWLEQDSWYTSRRNWSLQFFDRLLGFKAVRSAYVLQRSTFQCCVQVHVFYTILHVCYGQILQSRLIVKRPLEKTVFWHVFFAGIFYCG